MQVPPKDSDFYKTGKNDLNDGGDDSVTVNNADEEITSTIVINFKNISFSPPRKASVLVGEIEDLISFSTANTLHEAMHLPAVTDAGIFEKKSMNKDFYINVVVDFGNGTKNHVTISPKGAECVTIETLLTIPYVQNTHPGFVEIEVKETEGYNKERNIEVRNRTK